MPFCCSTCCFQGQFCCWYFIFWECWIRNALSTAKSCFSTYFLVECSSQSSTMKLRQSLFHLVGKVVKFWLEIMMLWCYSVFERDQVPVLNSEVGLCLYKEVKCTCEYPLALRLWTAHLHIIQLLLSKRRWPYPNCLMGFIPGLCFSPVVPRRVLASLCQTCAKD